VPLKISYLLMRWLFELVVLVFRADRAGDAELLVLVDVGPGQLAALSRLWRLSHLSHDAVADPRVPR
jgi:hypothetical protein